MEFIESIVKALMYWIFGIIYIGMLMGVSWLWHIVISDTPWTFADAFFAAAIVFVPLVVGKVMTMSD